MRHIIHGEELLEAHAADSCNSIQTRQRQRGNAHGHENRRRVARNAKHLKEARNAAAEDLERGARCGHAVCCCRCTGHAKRQNCKQALEHHCAVTDFEHVLFVFNRLRRRTGGDEAVEAGDCAAGHRDEQNREHRAKRRVEARKGRQIHRGVRDQKADGCARDHTDEHERRHVVARLLEKPHRKHGREEDVDEGDVAPGRLAVDERTVHADGKGGGDEQNAEHCFLPTREVPLFLYKAKYHGKDHEHD